MKIGLAPNPLKTEAVRLAVEIADWLLQRDISVLMIDEVAATVRRQDLGATQEQVISADLLVVLGGDGTMLRWSRLAAPRGTPMMGVNFGQYGFITEIGPESAVAALDKYLSGDCSISDRVVLKAALTRNGDKIGTYYALNDVVVSKGPLARMLGLHTYVNDNFIVTHAADGIIMATPTGSTAYSLSAGGPVVHPSVRVIIVTPICSHTLNARSLVVPDGERIQVIGECGSDGAMMMLTIDGQLGEVMHSCDKVEVGKADFTAKLVQIDPQSFYDRLRRRLRWGERLSG